MKIFLLAKLIVPENANRYWRIRKKENDDNWELRELSDELAIKIQNGIMNRPGRNNLNVKDINVVNLYESDKINPKSLSYIDVSNNELEKFRAQFGDVFITRSSLKAEGIAHPNILLSYGNYVFDDHIMRLRFLNSNDPYFMSLLLSTKQAHNQLMSKSKTGSMTTIGHKDVETINILRPGKVEQNNISKLFNLINQTITLHQRKADQLNTLKKALLQKMFADQKHRQPELRFKGFSGDWEQRKLENLLNYERSDKYMVKNTDYTNSGIPVLTANKSFILGYSKENNSYNDVPAIIFDDFTLDSKLVNFPFLVKSSAIKILTANANNSIVFLYYLLKHTPFIQEGHARHYISIVQKTKVMIPKATAEQNELAKMFIKLQNIITLHQKKINKLKSLKKHLLQNMFI